MTFNLTQLLTISLGQFLIFLAFLTYHKETYERDFKELLTDYINSRKKNESLISEILKKDREITKLEEKMSELLITGLQQREESKYE